MNAKLKYNILSDVKSELMIAISSVHIFTLDGNTNTFIITNSEDVYGFGDNNSGKLGLGHCEAVPVPTLITELCGKRITKIVEALASMAALTQWTERGQVYVWGKECRPTVVNPNKDHFIGQVVDLSSTKYGSVSLLTQSGSVYWFGYKRFNQCNQMTPIRMTGAQDQEFVQISSGYDHIIALTFSGRVYSSGWNSRGQLGLGHNNHCEDFDFIEMNDNVFIKSLATHWDHTLLLSTEGNIYSFGGNSFGQLGVGETGGQKSANKPKLIANYNQFKEVFVYKNKSFSISEEGFVYVWGQGCDLNNDSSDKVLTPKRTELKTFQEAINNYCEQPFSYRPLNLKDLFEKKNRIIDTMTSAFDCQKYSDFEIKVKEKSIYVHKWFIANNCQHFDAILSQNLSEYEIKEHTYDGYYAFLRCLYTDSIDTTDVLVDFLDITNEYNEEELKLKCIYKIKPLIDSSNVCSLYSASIKHISSELKVHCFEYMAENMDKIIATKDYKQMDSIYAKRFLTQYIGYLFCESN